MQKARYNIVLIGKTGVGKSSLGNYIFDQKIFSTGIGTPVTLNGFHPLEFNLEGLPVTVFDSWGLESGKSDQWLIELENELKNRSTTKEAKDWFHTVFYCIQAGGHRIEPFEINIIKKFIADKYKVTVIFTKADTVSDEELNGLKKVLREEFGSKVQSIEVCSEEKIRRDKSVAKAFGREEIIKSIISNFWVSISMRLPYRCIDIMHSHVNQWKKKKEHDIKLNTGYFNTDDINAKLKDDAKVMFKELCKGEVVITEIKKTIDMFAGFQLNLWKLSFANVDTTFLNKIVIKERSWWFYFPTNLFTQLFVGKSDNQIRLNKVLKDLADEMEKEINKSKFGIEKIINDLNPNSNPQKVLTSPK